FPDDPAGYAFDLQYCLGRELLVSPVVREDGVVTTYLPRGKWTDWWNGAVHEGPTTLRRQVPREELPLYVRDESLVVLGPERRNGSRFADRDAGAAVTQLSCHPTLDRVLSAIALGPRALHFSNDGRIDDQTAEGRDRSHVEPGEPMHRLHEDAQVGQVPTRCWPNRERHEGVYRRVAQLTQLLVLEPIEDAEASVRGPRSDQGPGAIRRAETIRVGFSAPSRTLVIPSEQGADAAAQPEEPLDHRGRRLEPRDHHGPQILDSAAGAAA